MRTGPVDSPGELSPVCSAVVGLRNVGTKVGYSSFGPEVGVAAPAGNCVNDSGPCLKPIDTTNNTGLTVPADSTYTSNTVTPNLGTSFSAPIVSGIAALMRSVNANLTPPQLIERIRSSAVAFPQPAGVPVCPASATDPLTGKPSGICACPNDGSQCGSGMVDALAAVTAALNPIAAIALPASAGNGAIVVLDGGGSSAACSSTIVSYLWTATGAMVQRGTEATSKSTITLTGNAGTIRLTVTDSSGRTNTAVVSVSNSGTFGYVGTATAGTATATEACPAALTVTVNSPTVSEAFVPAMVGPNVVSTLTLTFTNPNPFDLTQSHVVETLPANLLMAASTPAGAKLAPATTCAGGASVLTTTAGTVTLTGAIIPALDSCTLTVPVQSATFGSYVDGVAVNALTTGPGWRQRHGRHGDADRGNAPAGITTCAGVVGRRWRTRLVGHAVRGGRAPGRTPAWKARAAAMTAPTPVGVTLVEPVRTHRDARGALFEPLSDAELAGQKNVHVVLTQPGEVRGNHMHLTASETTSVVGPCLVRLKEHGAIRDLDVPAGAIWRLTIPPGVVHAYRNTGSGVMVLVSFSTNPHDPAGADTRREIIL